MTDYLADDREMDVDQDQYRHVKRDWVTLLAPGLLAALLSVLGTLGAGAYFYGQMTQQMNVLRIDVDFLKHDYMPKSDIEKSNDATKHTIERIDDKLDRIYDKLDRRGQ